MNKKVLNTIKEYQMIKPNDRVLIALSGGADSMALAHFLNSEKNVLSIEIFAVHVNHCLRGEEADRDEAFVRQWCEKNSIPCFVKKVDIRTLAKQRNESEELCARNERYRIFSSFGNDIKIATAHNFNDCIETALFNITRGTSPDGVNGIPPVRDNIIRPLISCTRAEIEEYCNSNCIEYVTDSTNLTDDYSRNIIRNNVIPQLKRINSSLENNFKRFFEQTARDADFINNCVDEVYKKCVKDDYVLIDEIMQYHSALRTRVYHRFVKEKFDISLENIHIAMIDDALKNQSKVMIKNNLTVSCLKGKAFFCIAEKKSGASVSIVNKLAIDYEEFVKNYLTYKNCFDFFADYDKIKGEVFLRNRLPGDKIKPMGRNCTKTLKKLLNELAVPENKRDSIPLLCDEAGILAVVGYALSERIKITSQTKKVLLIKMEEKYEK